MQRKYQFLWLALVPLGAAGALATGMVSLPWQPSNDSSHVTAPAKPAALATPAAVAKNAQPKAGKLAALDKQPKPAKLPLTKVPGASGDPLLSTKKTRKFGIDVARISPDGSSVIAGYSEPGKPVTIMANGKPIGVVTPDQSGDWVLVTPHKFASSDPKITLRAGDHTVKTVAALAAKSSTAKKAAPQSAASGPTASQVTQQMLQHLKKLTREASSEAARAKTAAAPVEKAQVKQRRDSASTAVAQSAPEKSGPAKSEPAQSAAQPAEPKQQLALVVTPSRLGGPQKPAKQSTVAALPKAAQATDQRVAAAPALAQPAATQAAPANVQKAALSESIPVPVQFVYREAVFTEQGREAAALLLKYFKAKNFKSVVLSGHADERGTAAANKQLSRQRLASIRKFLRDGGFDGRMKLIPMGETQKFTGVDRSKFSIEELYQLDRRVEVMSAQ